MFTPHLTTHHTSLWCNCVHSAAGGPGSPVYVTWRLYDDQHRLFSSKTRFCCDVMLFTAEFIGLNVVADWHVLTECNSKESWGWSRGPGLVLTCKGRTTRPYTMVWVYLEQREPATAVIALQGCQSRMLLIEMYLGTSEGLWEPSVGFN